jgi:hypothetical protein
VDATIGSIVSSDVTPKRLAFQGGGLPAFAGLFVVEKS